MILELYKYLTTPAPLSARKLGQLKESIAMEARYKRSEKQWQSHLTNSQNIIKKAATHSNKHEEAIILGSGLLLDIPLDFLSMHYRHVYLVDIVHLKHIKKNIGHLKNVSIIEHDVTGLNDTLLKSVRKKNDITPSPSIPCLTSNTGLVVSANMLSQIHLAPVYYAENQLKFREDKLKRLAHNIIQSHIDMLKNTACKICLISDFKHFYQNNKHQVQDEESALMEISLPLPEKTWRWEIAPMGELHPDLSMSSLVYAYSNFR